MWQFLTYLLLLDVSNNFHDSNRNSILDGTALCAQKTCYGDMDIVRTKYNYPGPTKLRSPQDAVTYVLANVGTTFPARDAVDKILVAEVQSWGMKGQVISDEKASPMYGPGYIAGGTKPTDSDGDGIPDAWEHANGLNPRDSSDAMKISSSGYANIEVYLNSLVPSS
ncbi:hypothetical protein RRF57_010231 [Xylaria bambusicola]|uniref:Uncharacterized protein n=1 Tax=Xylaria bambusicola TaxID=326684 RepID=A0AAN7UWB7_9PEZI